MGSGISSDKIPQRIPLEVYHLVIYDHQELKKKMTNCRCFSITVGFFN